MNAHDVRRLRICPGCHMPDMMENMIPNDTGFWHGSCFVTEFGEQKFLALPRSHVGGLRLDDIGINLMRKLLEYKA